MVVVLFGIFFLLQGIFGQPECRFAKQYTAEDLLNNPAEQLSFLQDVMYYEGQFHQDQIGYNAVTGLTYDGRPIDFITGQVTTGLHDFSASSKEAVHVSLLTLALNGDKNAQIFVSPSNPSLYENITIGILTNKISSYEKFNQQFPGFGGFFPWFVNNNTGMTPTSDFAASTPSLDNGELVWAIFACANVLRDAGYEMLAKRYYLQFNMMATNAMAVFYDVASNYYTQGGYLDDPPWPNPAEREKVWEYKRALLQPVNYTSPYGNITVQRDRYSSHEQWKLMELPYMDVPTPRNVFLNCERARTIYSAATNTPGLHASTNDVSTTLNIPDYVSDSGITELAFQPAPRTDIITPYGSFPVIIANFSVGLVWYHNMISGPKMQGPHGSTEAILVNGTEISPLLTWDTKITTVLAMLGGIGKLNAYYMALDGVLDRFVQVAEREYSLKFPILQGADIEFALPTVQIPTNALQDFTLCSASK